MGSAQEEGFRSAQGTYSATRAPSAEGTKSAAASSSSQAAGTAGLRALLEEVNVAFQGR